MFVRIVKMSFHSKYIEEFQQMFDEKKTLIRNTKGCQLLELYQDKNNPEILSKFRFFQSDLATNQTLF